jgi:phosphosulfolactate synthase
MYTSTLTLPEHQSKPRTKGLTMVIDGGLPTHYFTDVVSSFSGLIDVMKLGWGTSLVTDDLKYKIDALTDANVDFYFGGTLFEKFVSQGRFDDWRRFVDRFGARHVEISNGTIDMSNTEKADYIRRVAGDYTVYSEVGYKETARSEAMCQGLWVKYINEDLEAGASWVITEARESGKSGICSSNGELKLDLIEEIAGSGIDIDKVLFEAPNKDLQVQLIRRFGSQVNLGNISTSDIVALETLRLGLRGDTLLDWDDPDA